VKALAADFKQFFVFGDSLSDTGNVFTVTQGQFPAPTVSSSDQPAYFSGRFSNGPNWVDYFGQQIADQELEPTPFAAVLANPQSNPSEGVNFAFGGALTGIGSSFSGLPGTIPGVKGQVGLFTNFKQAFPVDPNAIYAVSGGSNDYFSGKAVSEVVKNLSDSIASLAELGAKNIVVFDLPDLGATPFGKSLGRSQELSQLTADHNQQLTSALKGLRVSNPDANIIPIPISKYFEEIRATPAKFGLTDVVNACVTGNFLKVESLCDNPDQRLFFDDVHPNTRIHQVIAQRTLAAVEGKSVPEPSYLLGILALGSWGAVGLLKRQRTKLTSVTQASVAQSSGAVVKS
jgi:phospholipase/lecithinase/hemolysin